MADSKITALASIGTGTDPANDPLVIVDVSDISPGGMSATGTTKKVTLNNLLACSPTATLASATITGDLTVRTNKLAVTSTGVGIGTASPTAAFDIFGAFGTSTAAAVLRNNSAYNNSNIVETQYFATNSNTGLDCIAKFGALNPAATGNNYGQFYWQIANAGSPTTAMTLNSTGLGVGEAASVSRLQPRGSTSDSSAYVIYAKNSGGSVINFMRNDGRFIVGNGTTDNFIVTETGNVGIGVASPNGKLEVQESGTGSGIGGIFTSTVSGGGTPGVVFRTASTNRWSLSLTGSAGAESIRFYDINNAATRVTITDAGNFLVGTTNTSATAGVGFKSQFSSTVPQFAIVVNEAGTSTNFSIYNVNAAAYRFYVNNGGTVFATNTTISAISDARLKENVQDIDVGLGAILALKPRKFDWKEGKGKNIKGDRGFIAQEFEQVFPQLVDEWKDAAPEGEAPYKSVRQDLIPVLVKAIQELTARVQTLETR